MPLFTYFSSASVWSLIPSYRLINSVAGGLAQILQIADDMKFTYSHVVEPVERGFARINKTFREISENVKRHEERKRSTKDDSYLVPLNSWSKEFSEAHDKVEGSISDSGVPVGKRHRHQASVYQFRNT